MKRRQLLAAAAALLAVACLAGFLELRTYSVAPDRSNLAQCVTEFYNRGYSGTYDPILTLYGSVTLGRETIVALDLDGKLGRVLLEENPLGWYKITGLGCGGGSFRCGSRTVDGETYLLLEGRNLPGEIAAVGYTFPDGSFTRLEVPPGQVFLVCAPAADPDWDGDVSMAHVTLWDDAGADITDRYDRSGGGI